MPSPKPRSLRRGMFPHSSHETGLARRICFRSLRAVTAALLNQAKREAAKPGFGKSAVLLTHRGKPKAYTSVP